MASYLLLPFPHQFGELDIIGEVRPRQPYPAALMIPRFLFQDATGMQVADIMPLQARGAAPQAILLASLQIPEPFNIQALF